MSYRQIYAIHMITILLAMASDCTVADFVAYEGGAETESEWRTAAGVVLLEDFESYSDGVQISSLPDLGVRFEVLAGGGFPDAYLFGDVTPYGPVHLANFPNGINAINRWDDIVLYVLPGREITALGFWNGDGQRDTLVATAFDASGTVLGSVGAFKGTFAGFISDVAVAKVVFDGNTGDGWNHLDGLQTNATSTKPQISVKGGFIKLDVTGGNPPSSTDCTIPEHHFGRMVADEVNNTLYLCTDSGWMQFTGFGN